MTNDERLALGETRHRLIERRAYGHGQQGLVLRAAGIAGMIHGFRFL
jgi:hypothetical protein